MKNSIFTTVGLLLSMGLLLASGGEKSNDYQVDLKESSIQWLGSKPGGEHNGIVSLSAGKLMVNKGKLAGGKFTIDFNSIVNLDLEAEEWNKKLVDHLKSKDFFYVEKYPTASFEISKAVHSGGNEYTVSGILTIKEVSKSITFKANVDISDDNIQAESEEIIIDRTQWKVEAMSKTIFADLKDKYVDDELKITIKLLAKSL